MEQNELGFIEKIVSLNRVAKVVKGGRRFSFSALMVVGDGNGNVGFGLGKAQEVPEALRKATEHARKNMVKVPLIEGTLPYEILGEFGAGRVMLKPASRGTGIIAGGAVRAVMEAAGVNDVLAKAIGTNNPHNVLRATMAGLAALRSAEAVSEIRGMKLEVAPCLNLRLMSLRADAAARPTRRWFWTRSGCAAAKWLRPFRITLPSAA